MRRIPRIEQVLSSVGGDRPVVVLSGAIDPCKRLFMEQADKVVPFGNPLHQFHGQLVVVRSDIGRGEDRRQLVLRGRNLVVLGLGQNTELPKLFVQVFHKLSHPGFDGAKIVVVQFLSLWRLRPKERSSGINQIRPFIKHFPLNQEVLLFRPDRRFDRGHIAVTEELQHPHRLFADGLHGVEQRRLFIQGFPSVGAERRRNTKRLPLDKCIGSGVPSGVAPRFKGCAQAAGWERGGVRLTLDQLLAGKFQNDAPIFDWGDKTVMLFCGDSRHRLEPMGKVGCPFFNRPVLHRIRNHIGNCIVQMFPLLNGALQLLIRLVGQTFPHNRIAENVRSKNACDCVHNNTPFHRK